MSKTYQVIKDGYAAVHPGFNTEYVHTGDSPDEAFDKARENAEAVHGGLASGILASTRTEEVVYPDVTNFGRVYNNTPQQLNEAGHDWVWADDDPENWPDEVVAYLHDEAGSASILITEFGTNEGDWADPEHDNEPVCLECIRAADTGSVEGEDDPEDSIDAEDYEQGEDDPEYKAAIANFEFTYKKLETSGKCWCCLQMWEESGSPSGSHEGGY